MSILENISKYKLIMNDGQPGTLKTQEEAIVEIANHIIKDLPILAQDMIAHAKKHSVADTIAWDSENNPIAVIRLNKIDSNIFVYNAGLTFDGRLAMGFTSRNYYHPCDMEDKQFFIKQTVNFDDLQHTVTSADDRIYKDFPRTLNELFRLSYNITEMALKMCLSTERVTTMNRLSIIGNDILKKYRYW